MKKSELRNIIKEEIKDLKEGRFKISNIENFQKLEGAKVLSVQINDTACVIKTNKGIFFVTADDNIGVTKS